MSRARVQSSQQAGVLQAARSLLICCIQQYSIHESLLSSRMCQALSQAPWVVIEVLSIISNPEIVCIPDVQPQHIYTVGPENSFPVSYGVPCSMDSHQVSVCGVFLCAHRMVDRLQNTTDTGPDGSGGAQLGIKNQARSTRDRQAR